jgi:hypothetical protein
MYVQRTKWIIGGVMITCSIIAMLAGCSDDKIVGPTTDQTASFQAFLTKAATGAGGYAASMNDGDAVAYCANLDVNFTQLPPDAPPNYGRPAMLVIMTGFFEALDVEDFTINTQDFKCLGDMGYSWGLYTFRMAPHGTDLSNLSLWTQVDGKFESILRQQDDDTWLFYIDAFNSNVAPPPCP